MKIELFSGGFLEEITFSYGPSYMRVTVTSGVCSAKNRYDILHGFGCLLK